MEVLWWLRAPGWLEAALEEVGAPHGSVAVGPHTSLHLAGPADSSLCRLVGCWSMQRVLLPAEGPQGGGGKGISEGHGPDAAWCAVRSTAGWCGAGGSLLRVGNDHGEASALPWLMGEIQPPRHRE